MSKDETTEEAEGPAKSGKKKLLILALVVLAAGAAAAWFFVFSGTGAEAEAEAPHPGATVVLDPVAVNLAGGGYLKVGVTLQLTEDAVAEVNGTKALNLIISQFSQAQPADIVGARDALKEALEQKIIEAYEGDVMGIYYSEYVTQ